MPISGLISHLKATSTPIWLYAVQQHTSSSPVKVTSRGFLKDSSLLAKLTELSTTEASGLTSTRLVLYEKTVVVPTFVDSKTPNGTVTIKIKATASPKQGFHLHDSSTGQSIPMADPAAGPPTSLEVYPLVTGAVEEVDSREHLPNTWFPPPLCFTSKSASDLSDGGSISHTDDPETEGDHIDQSLGQTGQRGLTANHWSVLMECSGSSFPWKGMAPVHPPTSGGKPKLDSSPHHVDQHQGPTEGDTFQRFPCLSALYRELSLLHEGQFPSNRRKDVKSQSVQTDQSGQEGRTKETIICEKDCTVYQKGPLQNFKHQYCQVREEDLQGHPKEEIENKKEKGPPTGRERKANYTTGEDMNISPEVMTTSGQWGIVEHAAPLPEACATGFSTEINKEEDDREDHKLNSKAYSAVDPKPPKGITEDGPGASTRNYDDDDHETNDSTDLSSDETSQPFVIPLMTLSPPSTVNFGSQEDPTLASSPADLSPPFQSSQTGTLSPVVSRKQPHPSQLTLQSTKSLTLTEGTANEVKCANNPLGQKVYLALSLQSLDRVSSLKGKEGRDSVSEYSTIRDSLECSTDSSSTSQVSSCRKEEIIMEEIDKEISLSGGYDDYSDDFESVDSNS